MKNFFATNRFRILMATATFIFCGAAISLFLMEPVMSASRSGKPHIEKQGRLTIFRFDIKASSTTIPVAVRVVVSREKKFRLTRKIAENFPHIDAGQLETEKIIWVLEQEPSGKEHLPDSWAGLFLAFDGDYGHIQSLMHAHRVYRKYLNEFEIDYVFSAESVARSELAKQIYEIDKQVFEVLKNSEAFHK